MEKYFKDHPFAKTGLFIIPLIALVLIMGNYFPPTFPKDFGSFIVAFEFAKTPQEIHHLLGKLSNIEIKNVDIGNYFDFGFMFCYSLLLLLFYRIALNEFQKKWVLAGIILSVFIFFSDFFENLILLEITRIYSPEMDNSLLIPLLQKLQVVTWLKWGSLSILFIPLFFLFRKGWILQIIRFGFLFPFLFGLLTILNQTPKNLILFTNLVFIAFTALFVTSFLYRKSNSQ